jgi:NAD(P)-dependent dehydrogenase (short-subunit alcohol dehydrogenase family)
VFDVTDLKAIEDAYAEVARICGNAGIATVDFQCIDVQSISRGQSLGKCLITLLQQRPALPRPGLYGLVNNAGIANGSLLDLCPLDVFFQTMAVNFDAIVYMCKIFLPLLKTAGQATPEGSRCASGRGAPSSCRAASFNIGGDIPNSMLFCCKAVVFMSVMSSGATALDDHGISQACGAVCVHRVINIASVAGRLGLTGTSNYSGSKFAGIS